VDQPWWIPLSSIILFNKWCDEAARMLLNSYRQSGHVQKSGLDDIQGTLTETEQKLCS